MNWHSKASIEALKARAKLNRAIRLFFEQRDVLEVETPLLGSEAVSDPYIDCFEVFNPISKEREGFLQSSPEYYLKRMLASGSGDIYQLGKVFRANETGSNHSIEFTLLEWYRIGWTLEALIQEVLDLLALVGFDDLPVHRFGYSELFQKYCDIDVHSCELAALQSQCKPIYGSAETLDFEECCDLLLTHIIEPEIQPLGIVIITDFLASQAALAKIDPVKQTARRFEVYLNGKEIANGYDELLNGEELARRTAKNNVIRQQNHKPLVSGPMQLIQAMAEMPDCVGVALGVDRLLMEIVKAPSIEQILSFKLRK